MISAATRATHDSAIALRGQSIHCDLSTRRLPRLLPLVLAAVLLAALLPATAAKAGPVKPPPGWPGITITFPDGPTAENGSLVRVLFDANGAPNITGFRYDSKPYFGKFRYFVPADAPGGRASVTVLAEHLGPLRVYVGDQDATSPESDDVVYSAEITVVGDPSISGLVIEEGMGRAGATVTLQPSGRTTVTDAAGYFRFDHVSPGEYAVHASLDQGCDLFGQTTGIKVPSQYSADVWAHTQQDPAGYHCHTYPAVGFGYEPGEDVLDLTGDNAYQEVPLPFTFTFYGEEYDRIWVDTNGYLALVDPGASFPVAPADFPSPTGPRAVIAPYWDDLIVDGDARVRTRLITDHWGMQTFVVDWHNVARLADPQKRFSINVHLNPVGTIWFHYEDLDAAIAASDTVGVGVNGPAPDLGVRYDQRAEPLSDDRMVRIFDQ